MIKINSLQKIANWQLNEELEMTLPNLQRGFVWKPSQIENLWDSILSGFPIGSFLCSENNHLYDGQQRSTAIAIGFYNPWKNKNNNSKNFWKLTNVPVLWLDLNPNAENLNDKSFLLRTSTKSHPWGYKAKNNNEILSVSDRMRALKLFQEIEENKNRNYSNFNLIDVFPFDANCPIPLCFLLEIIIDNEINDINIVKKELEKLINKYKLSDSLLKNWKIDINKINETYLKKIIDAVKQIENVEIPIISVETNLFETTNTYQDNDEIEENPILFVKLNSAGTPIAGEELIYSIYKAKFPNFLKIIDNLKSINQFLSPSKIISLLARLAKSELNLFEYVSPLNNVNIFNSYLSTNGFKEKLEEIIKNGEDIFNIVMDLFENNKLKLPKVLIKQLLSTNTELLFILLATIRKNNNVIDKERTLAYFVTIAWYCKDAKSKEIYVKHNWNKLNDTNGCWFKLSYEYRNKNGDLLLPPLPKPEYFKEFLINEGVKKHYNELYPNKDNKNIYSFFENCIIKNEENINDMWDLMCNKTVINKALILFAQRNYINEKFKDFSQTENLEDTNTPWDWDHIYPASWCYKKHNINKNMKHWNNHIGNLRAIGLQENRSDNNNKSPKNKLDNPKNQKEFFINDDLKYWSQIEEKITNNKKDEINNHLTAIIIRTCNIYDEFYTNFKINKIV